MPAPQPVVASPAATVEHGTGDSIDGTNDTSRARPSPPRDLADIVGVRGRPSYTSTGHQIPEWVACAHGDQQQSLNEVYVRLSEVGCDPSSIMSFFCMAQFNPAAFEKGMEIIADMEDALGSTRGVRSTSAFLAGRVEAARRSLYPEGDRHAGKQSIDVEAHLF